MSLSLRPLPGELRRIQAYSSHDYAMSLHIFSFGDAEQQPVWATMEDAEPLLKLLTAEKHSVSKESVEEFVKMCGPSYMQNLTPSRYFAERKLYESVCGTEGVELRLHQDRDHHNPCSRQGHCYMQGYRQHVFFVPAPLVIISRTSFFCLSDGSLQASSMGWARLGQCLFFCFDSFELCRRLPTCLLSAMRRCSGSLHQPFRHFGVCFLSFACSCMVRFVFSSCDALTGWLHCRFSLCACFGECFFCDGSQII